MSLGGGRRSRGGRRASPARGPAHCPFRSCRPTRSAARPAPLVTPRAAPNGPVARRGCRARRHRRRGDRGGARAGPGHRLADAAGGGRGAGRCGAGGPRAGLGAAGAHRARLRTVVPGGGVPATAGRTRAARPGEARRGRDPRVGGGPRRGRGVDGRGEGGDGAHRAPPVPGATRTTSRRTSPSTFRRRPCPPRRSRPPAARAGPPVRPRARRRGVTAAEATAEASAAETAAGAAGPGDERTPTPPSPPPGASHGPFQIRYPVGRAFAPASPP